MPTTRTEYAVRYTAWRYGAPKVVVTETDLPADRDEARWRMEAIRAEQADHRALPVDAEIVTRTVTTTEWA
jgi:hypothetical protein